MTTVTRYDYSAFTATKTDEGFLVDSPIVARIGIQEYRRADGSIRKELRLPGAVGQRFVDLVEALDRVFLAVESLDDGVPAIHLFHMPVDVAEVVLLLLEVLLRLRDDEVHRHYAQDVGMTVPQKKSAGRKKRARNAVTVNQIPTKSVGMTTKNVVI